MMEEDSRRSGESRTSSPTDSSAMSIAMPESGRTTRQQFSQMLDNCSFDPTASYAVEDGLVYCSRERLQPKDFSSEVRGQMDIEQFASQAEILLDPRDVVSMEDIVDSMLELVAKSEDLNLRRRTQLFSEAKEVLFLPGSTLSMARVIQGASSLTKFGGHQNFSSLDFDQSWLCALCDLACISKRHMVLARFRNAMNMGENANEVRLFLLVCSPREAKGTKNAYETGRSFSALLTDHDLRCKLIEAKTETEVRALMVMKAQQLNGQSGSLKVRHKYQLDAAVQRAMVTLKTDTSNGFTNNNNNKLALDKNQTNGNHQQQQISLSQLSSPQKSFYSNGKTAADGSEQDRVAGLFGRHPDASKLIELIYQTAANKDGTVVKPDSCKPKRPTAGSCCSWSNIEFGKGLWEDFCRRAKVYPSDFKDAFVGPPKTVQKTVATTWFLYFGILLPIIAFSSLNNTQTNGQMGDLRKAIIGQAIGGLAFALLGGQPLVIIMTTAPLCLYTKVIYNMCNDYGFHFPAMYAAVGLWNGFFLIIYSLFGFSRLMKWCTRSTEEVFAMFIVVAFVTDACKDMVKNFHRYYYTPACKVVDVLVANSTTTTSQNATDQLISTIVDGDEEPASVCRRETSLLFVLLMLGTLWLAITLYRFNKTPYLATSIRELLADYALPIAVIAMSFIGSYVFDDVYAEKFRPLGEISFERAQVEMLPLSGILTAMGLGFTLSLLFFMDQNISAAMVNAPQNRLKKGCGYHFDLLVVAVLNGFLTMYGLPMMHGVLPHSPLHVRSLADIEQRVEQGHVCEVITNVRETRVTGTVSHILILLSLLLIPYPIAYIPTAVLNGLFLYMAVTSLDGLQIFERIMLMFTEQNKYPPNHYIRRCPQKKIHQFTFLQLIQLLILCLLGFSPINVVEMFFPVIILLFIPFRHQIVPRIVGEKYLQALDGKH